ncbi:MAG: transposase [Candidatus Altiarchaeota archaeon]|nr:transposase [Candidatus Altiarchaeota archaeon]
MNQELQNPREIRGLEIAQKGGIKQIDMNKYLVPSQYGNGAYKVDLGELEPTCSCPDFETRHHDIKQCKHIIAVSYFLKFEKDRLGNTTVTQVKKVTYSQDWKAYNQAQTQEITLFDELLKDLVIAVPEPEMKTGRPRKSLRDDLFCSIQKVYSQLSQRRAHTLYRNAGEREQIDNIPHFNRIGRALNREDVTPILHDLLKLSALPLRSVETQFAVDSSGFRTTQFGEYCREKHKTKQQHRWVKAHIIVGVKTNVITSAGITEEYGADCPQFEPLVKATHENGFSLKEVSADKGYVSRDNLALVDELGGVPYIPFKENSRGTRTRGSSPIWKKMYYLFQYRNEEFMAHYHKRSNVETVFQMVKAKFGDKLKSKNKVAQENELLCKLIAHNICVLIQEMHELGIQPDFYPLT